MTIVTRRNPGSVWINPQNVVGPGVVASLRTWMLEAVKTARELFHLILLP